MISHQVATDSTFAEDWTPRHSLSYHDARQTTIKTDYNRVVLSASPVPHLGETSSWSSTTVFVVKLPSLRSFPSHLIPTLTLPNWFSTPLNFVPLNFTNSLWWSPFVPTLTSHIESKAGCIPSQTFFTLPYLLLWEFQIGQTFKECNQVLGAASSTASFLIRLNKRTFGWSMSPLRPRNCNCLPISQPRLHYLFLVILVSIIQNSLRQFCLQWLSPVPLVFRWSVTLIKSLLQDVGLLFSLLLCPYCTGLEHSPCIRIGKDLQSVLPSWTQLESYHETIFPLTHEGFATFSTNHFVWQKNEEQMLSDCELPPKNWWPKIGLGPRNHKPWVVIMHY